MRLADILPQVQPALAGFLDWLDGRPPASQGATAGLEDLARRYGEIKSRAGRAAVATRMGLQEAELGVFDTALREATRRLERLPPDAPGFETRNAIIAALRLLSWLETVAQRAPDYRLVLTLPDQSNEEIGRKQVRALELILRSLITAHYEEQPKLIERLKELLSEKVVQQWLAAADRGDVLSGTSFSELASLFVSQQEFASYEPLYRETPFLSLLREKRQTIRNYLDDVRRVRNLLAHNKRVTPLTVQLLSLYYEELVEPLQEAFDRGSTTVNPDLYLDVDAEELEGYFSRLSDDMQQVRDDIGELRAELTGRLDRIDADTGEIKADTGEIKAASARIEGGTRAANRKLLLVAGGVLLVALLAGGGLWLGLGTKETTDRIAETTEKTNATVEEMAAGLKALANIGGLVADPKTPAEFYHNARLLAQRGESDRALENYRQLFTFDLPYADPVLDLVTLLKAKYGESGAAAALEEVLPDAVNPRLLTFARLAAGGETPMAAARRLESTLDPYPPELWLTVEGLMAMPYKEFSFGLRKLALTYMNEVQRGLADGSLAAYYLDQIRVEAIRQQLSGYMRQFPDGVMEAYDRPLVADWERYDWIGGEKLIRIIFMWNPAAAAQNRAEPAELWVRFIGQAPPWDQPFNIFDPETAVLLQKASYPPDMTVPPDLDKMMRDLARDQNPMASQFPLPRPDGPYQLAEIRFTEVGRFKRHLCLAVPNDDGEGEVEYRPLSDCAAQ